MNRDRQVFREPGGAVPRTTPHFGFGDALDGRESLPSGRVLVWGPLAPGLRDPALVHTDNAADVPVAGVTPVILAERVYDFLEGLGVELECWSGHR